MRKTILTVSAAAASVLMLVWGVLAMRAVFDLMKQKTFVGDIPYNDAVQGAIDLLAAQSNSRAQIAVVLLGLLGALWVAKADEPTLALRWRLAPEIVMWIAGVAMLVASLYSHNEYVQRVAFAIESGGVTPAEPGAPPGSRMMPDVFDDKYETLLSLQLRLLMAGAVASLLAILSVRHSARLTDQGSSVTPA